MLGPAEVASVGFADAIAALRDAVVDFDPESDRIRTRVPMENGDYVLMPSEVGAHTGIKVLTLTPGNPDRGLPFIQGAVLLSDSTTHTLQAVLDGAALTNLRTPALSFAAVSETLRARFPGGIRLVIVGTGVQGSLHLDAARSVVPVTHVTYGVRTAGRSRRAAGGRRPAGHHRRRGPHRPRAGRGRAGCGRHRDRHLVG